MDVLTIADLGDCRDGDSERLIVFMLSKPNLSGVKRQLHIGSHFDAGNRSAVIFDLIAVVSGGTKRDRQAKQNHEQFFHAIECIPKNENSVLFPTLLLKCNLYH